LFDPLILHDELPIGFEGESAVATRSFNAADVLRPSPFQIAHQAQITSYAATFASSREITNIVLGTDAKRPAESIVNLRLLGKGVGWALGIEGAMAMCAYAIWWLWHISQ
jgi:hypothetical protein